MTIMEKLDNMEEKKLWSPTVIIGGKEPPSVHSNWLLDLDIEDVFLTKAKPSQGNMNAPGLQLFIKVFQKGRAVRMMNPEKPEEAVFVDSDHFCRLFDLFQKLDKPGEPTVAE